MKVIKLNIIIFNINITILIVEMCNDYNIKIYLNFNTNYVDNCVYFVIIMSIIITIDDNDDCLMLFNKID